MATDRGLMLERRNLVAERWRQKEQGRTLRSWQSLSQTLAVLAFVLSLTTAVISIWTARTKDLHDRQLQLALTINRVQELMLKEAEILSDEVQRRSPMRIQAAHLINGQVFSQMRRAYELAINLGGNATTNELRTVSLFMIGLADFSSAFALLRIAIQAANSPIDMIHSREQLAFHLYHPGSTEEMRKEADKLFFETTEVILPDEDRGHPGARFIRAQTRMMWAEASGAWDCLAAKGHFGKGIEYIRSMGEERSAPQNQRLIRNAVQWIKVGFPRAPECKPETLEGLEQMQIAPLISPPLPVR